MLPGSTHTPFLGHLDQLQFTWPAANVDICEVSNIGGPWSPPTPTIRPPPRSGTRAQSCFNAPPEAQGPNHVSTHRRRPKSCKRPKKKESNCMHVFMLIVIAYSRLSIIAETYIDCLSACVFFILSDFQVSDLNTKENCQGRVAWGQNHRKS